MGDIDISVNEYLSDNKRFADVSNYYLFDGEQVILPTDLSEAGNTEAISSIGPYKGNGKRKGVKKGRDLLRKAVIRKIKGCMIAIIGIESQSKTNYTMPVRNLLYDGINYNNQLRELASENKEKKVLKSGAELLSGMRKEDRLCPVITLTVYFGTTPWDGSMDLHGMLDIKDEELLPFIDNYHLKLVDPTSMAEGDFIKFRTGLRQVFQLLHAGNDREEMGRLIDSDPSYHGLDKETALIIETLMSIDLVEQDKEVIDMCKAWKDHEEYSRKEGFEMGMKEGKRQGVEEGKRQGVEEGKRQGVEEGIERGKKQGLEEGRERTLVDAIQNVMKATKTDIRHAMSILQVPLSEQEKYLKLIQ